MRHLLPVFFLLFLALFARDGICLETAPEIGKLAPPFELSDVDGQKISLSTYNRSLSLSL